ncbi:MAG: hypothetical protein B6242_16030 [Anaerolineaceae bacterium 4572_78]|nr:MAG: hypothetical protein B6242_16030 [Anaerolineaceae bacterium 4572_78]
MLKNQHTYHSLFKSVGVVSLCSLLITPRYLIAAEFEAVEGQYIVKRSPYCASISSPSAANVLDVFPSIGAELWQMEAYTVNSLSTDSCIEYVEPNYIIRLDNTPNDPDFNQLWGLDKISATTAWDIRTESSIIIAVIDTGIDYTHPDLAANMWVNQGEIPNNGIDDDGNGYIDDIYGYDFANGDGEPLDDHFHGTHCAGTIAAIGNNGTGVVGVNWSAKIMALKFFKLDSFGRPSGKISDAISAIEYATSMGAKITSNSWGGGPESQALSDAIQFAQQKGALFIAAAGNKSVNTDRYSHYPSGYDLSNIISVAATDQYDALSEFSNYGATSVDLGAPGTDIYSTVPNGSYGTLSGTSMATPHVAGLAGLLWSHNPSWTYRKVRDKILSSVEPLSSLAGKTVSGGRLNAYKALADGTTPPPQPPGDGKVEAHIEPTTITGSAPFTVYLDGRTSVGQIIQYKWEASIEEMYDCPLWYSSHGDRNKRNH